MNECTFCSHNAGEKDGTVSCNYFGEVQIPESHCAAKILTSKGWEDIANKAKQRGDNERANIYYERAIETQIPEIL